MRVDDDYDIEEWQPRAEILTSKKVLEDPTDAWKVEKLIPHICNIFLTGREWITSRDVIEETGASLRRILQCFEFMEASGYVIRREYRHRPPTVFLTSSGKEYAQANKTPNR